MAPTDLEQLLSMGFEQVRAELAVKKTGNRMSSLILLFRCSSTDTLTVQGALEWLEDNQDKSLEEIQSESKTVDSGAGAAGTAEVQARSWVCNECDKKFRSTEALEFHAHKSYVFLLGHSIKPSLT